MTFTAYTLDGPVIHDVNPAADALAKADWAAQSRTRAALDAEQARRDAEGERADALDAIGSAFVYAGLAAACGSEADLLRVLHEVQRAWQWR